MNRKMKILFLACLAITIFSFSSLVLAAPEVTSYKIDGKQESAKLNPSLGGTVGIEISANVPVKFNTVAICSVGDSVCSRTTAVKYFTQTDFASSVSKEWNGKTSKDAIVSDGDYKIKVTMKDQSDQENIQELSPYIIAIDSNFSGGSVGNSSSVSESVSGGSQSSSGAQVSSSATVSGVSTFVSVASAYSSSVASSLGAKYSNTFEVNAGSDRLVYTDTPTEFTAMVGVPKGFSEQAVKYVWSFGDGSTGEGKKVSHVYKFAGDYIVVLTVSLPEISAVSRINIKAINSSVFVSNITNDFVEITNRGTFEINLKGWSVANSRGGKFVFLSDTIIAPSKKIAVPDEYMKLNLAQVGKISLLNPSGKDMTLPPVISENNLSLVDNKNSSSSSKSISVPKKILTGQVSESSGVKNKKVSSLEKGGTASSSVQVVATVSSQVPKSGFVRKILAIPSSGFSLIKRAFYSGN